MDKPQVYHYPFEHPKKENIVKAVCNRFNVFVYPEVFVINHEHLQRTVNQKTIVYGWYSHKYPHKVFISDRIRLNNVRQKEVLAHEIVHYCQYMIQSKYGIDQLEFEADSIAKEVVQSLYGG